MSEKDAVISQSQGSVRALKTFDLYCTSMQEIWAEISNGVLTAEIIRTVFRSRDINKCKTFCNRFNGEKEKCILL
jgi:hypothetical protein